MQGIYNYLLSSPHGGADGIGGIECIACTRKVDVTNDIGYTDAGLGTPSVSFGTSADGIVTGYSGIPLCDPD